jgi:hypothetical protein
MSTTIRRPDVASGGAESPEVLEAQRLHRKGEKYFYAGVIIVAATLIGPFGIPPLVYGLYLLRKVEKGGLVAVRPWHVSVIGAFAIADAGANFVGWSFDTFAAQTGIGWTMLRGWGHLFDGGYFKGYGSTWIGGVVADGEKSYIYMAVFVLWPIRLGAAWGFLKMKRWAFRWMVISSWMLVLYWVGWCTNTMLNFTERFGADGGSLYGYGGWWLYNAPYILGPVVMIPYFYTVNRELWTD